MANSVIITVKSEDTISDLERLLQIDGTKDKEGALALRRYFKDLHSGIRRGIVDVQVGTSAPVAAVGTITLVSFANNDTLTIGAVTITGKSSPTTEAHFEIDGSDTADAAALADCINAHSILSKIMVATSAVNVVTVTMLQKGIIGNHIVLTASAHATIVVPAGGTGGAQDAAVQYNLGIS